MSVQSLSNTRHHKVVIDRACFNERTLQETFVFQKTPNENFLTKYLIKNYAPSRGCMKELLCNSFPVFKWITKYNIRKKLLVDIIAGVTVGILQIAPSTLIPNFSSNILVIQIHFYQALANSQMAGLLPINGIYVAFFTCLAYFVFGTCKHLSLG